MAQSILLIEDSPGDARQFQIMAVGHGAAVCTIAETLKDGLALAASRPFDLCMLDLSLPDSFGIATVRKMVAAHPRMPVVVLTGNDDEAVGMAAVQAGAQDFLVKGMVDASLLRRTLRYAIERKAAALELLALAERHARILDALGEGVLEVSANGSILECNPAAEQLLAADKATLLASNLQEMCGPSVLSTIARVLENGVPLKVYDTHLTNLAGQPLQADLTITAARPSDGEGEQRLAIIAIRDLVDRNAAYDSIRQGLLLQEQIVEAMPVAMFMVDRRLRITHVNSAFARLIGKSVEDLLGFNVIDVLPQPLVERLPPPDLGLALAGSPADMLLTLEADAPPCRMKRRPLTDSRGHMVGFICSLQDGT